MLATTVKLEFSLFESPPDSDALINLVNNWSCLHSDFFLKDICCIGR